MAFNMSLRAGLILGGLGVLWAWPGTAEENPVFGLPVACEVAADCIVQNYFDHDPGPGRKDYACGRLSYDGHTGTDFRARDVVEMRAGREVYAAAAGRVRAIRDEMADVNVREIGLEAIKGREAGNGVVIELGGGIETQYSHLRLGSVVVKPGDQVEAGQLLGMIGMSGNAEFPHVEFLVRKDGVPFDPFTGSEEAVECGVAQDGLWSPEAAAKLAYVSTGLLVAGFADAAPEADQAREGAFRLGETAGDPPALVYWADLFGVEAGDVQHIEIKGPDGGTVFTSDERLKDSKVSWFAFGGKRRPEGGWPPGAYRGAYVLERDGKVIVDQNSQILLGN